MTFLTTVHINWPYHALEYILVESCHETVLIPQNFDSSSSFVYPRVLIMFLTVHTVKSLFTIYQKYNT